MSGDERPELKIHGERYVTALEALCCVRDEYGMPSLAKPCVAYVLDGNLGSVHRHEAAFVIALECRALNLTEHKTERVLTQWANKVDYRVRDACRAIPNAYAKTSGGGWRYHPPGVQKKPGTRAHAVLAATCADVGCPANCPAYSDLHRGPRGESFARFEQLGWPAALRRQRHVAAIDYYRTICDLEQERGFAAGAPLLTSYRQLGRRAGRDPRHAGENLRVLYTSGLLAKFEKGSGSGPNARDRQPSRVSRAVPIPTPPPRLLPQYKTGGGSPPKIDGDTPPWIGGGAPPNIGGPSR